MMAAMGNDGAGRTDRSEGESERKRARLTETSGNEDEGIESIENNGVKEEEEEVNFVKSNGKTCTHLTVWPEGMKPKRTGVPPKVEKYAKDYSFPLDPFQYTSINCIEQGESVMVAAHTSAGKTVVAEYAIAMALRDGQRVVYTSPLKALSNQKFRELSDTFEDVGLMTGDVTINPNASCLVMTTEILRQMLYRGSDVAIEVAWIIFDEIHYLRDKERGVVWEETIILVPDRVHFVFLSATLPNAKEFAGWIAKIHRQPCHLVSTDYRPTPLQHYMFPAGSSGLYMVVDEKSKFKPDNFQKAIAELGGSKEHDAELLRKEKKKRNQEDILKIVQLIMERKFDPCIIFAFSKRECENLATKLTNLDLTTGDEKKLIGTIFMNAIECLSSEDKRLPQIKHVLPLLKQGIGIHHSGLLPILKEVVEILFQEGLLKCLFATETFSTGLNMPAKTVVFVRPRKFDGGGFRWLSSGEYIQMSGRAGRRGLDDKGIVILMLDSKMEPAVARQMVQGSADPLVSAFHLSFNMILNLCRTESGDAEALMRASYRQYQTELALPSLRKRVKELKDRCKFHIENEDKLEESFLVLQKIGQLHVERRKMLQNPAIILPFLQPGRLVRVLARDLLDMEHYLNTKEYSTHNSVEESDIELEARNLVERITKMDESVWGCVVNFKKVSTRNGPSFQVDVLVGTSGKDSSFALLKSTAENAKPKVITFDLARIDALSKVRMYLPPDLRSLHARQKLHGAIREVEARFAADSIPLLDPEEDMKLDDKEYRKVCRKLESLEDMVEDQDLTEGKLKEGYKLICKKSILKSMANAAKRESSASNSLVGKEELKARRRMLRKLDYVDSNQIVQTKGHIAAEISSADELVLTELLVNGTFKNLPHDQTVAILSCFVHSEKSSLAFDSESTSLLEEHFQLFSKLRDQVRRIASVAKDMRLNLDMEKYLDSFSPQLMEASAAWARGSNFASILKMSKVFEGSLVRAIRRVDELLQQLIAACKSIGENEQADHFSQCSDQIKKDVVFAASLYL